MERTRAATHYLQTGVVAIFGYREFQRKFHELRMQSWNGDLHSFLRFCTEYKIDLDSGAWRPSEIDSSDVRLAFTHRQPGLLDPVRRGSFQLYRRRMLPYECMHRIHRDEVVGTDRAPLLVLHPLTNCIGRSGRLSPWF